MIALAATAPGLLAYPFAAAGTVRSSFGRVAGVADFNRDGRADILMASDHELVWMRNTGGSSFVQAASMTFAVPTIRSIKVADIDKDGAPDVVLNTAAPSQLIILRNEGNIVFNKKLEATVGTAPLDAGVITGDYDFDGDIDVAVHYSVTGETQNKRAWARNDGGTFTLQAGTSVAANEWQFAAADDFNRDDRLDVMMAVGSALLEYGDGPFAPSSEWLMMISGITTNIETGDLSGDGAPDIVITVGAAATGAQSAAWFRWQGNGFSTANVIQNHTTGRVRGTHLMDVDEDGDLDAVFNDQAFYASAASQAPQQIMWAENDGGNLLAGKVLFDNTEAWVIMSGDVDGDGDRDLVWSENGDIMVSLNNAIHRTAEFGEVVAAGAPSAIGGLCTGEVGYSSTEDFIYSIPGSGAAYMSNGNAYFEAPPGTGSIQTVTSTLPGASVVAAGDVDHNGYADVAIFADGDTVMHIGRRSGSGSWNFTNWGGVPSGARSAAIADVDNDNHPDVVIGHTGGITLMRNTSGNGSGWGTEAVFSAAGPFTKVWPVQMNGSGRMEIIAMTEEKNPSRCRVYRFVWATLQSAWTASVLYDGDAASSFLTVGDVNRDQAPDVIYSVNGTVNCVPGSFGVTTLGTAKPIAGIPAGMRAGGIADFNRDGLPDFVVAGGTVALLALGKGDGTFTSLETIYSNAAASLSRMAVLDFDHDGDTDILVVDDAVNKIRVLYNGCGQFDLKETALTPGPDRPIHALPGSAPLVMRLEFTHAGRTGDAAAALRSLRFRLRKAVGIHGEFVPSAGLTTAEATALISGVEVYLDRGESGNFESGTDTLIGSTGPATADGRLTVTPGTSFQSLLTPGAGQTIGLWVVLRMSATANTSPNHRFLVEHILDPAAGGSMFVHAGLSTNFRLDPMTVENAAPMIVVPGPLETWRKTNWNQYESIGLAANDADPDGDGVPNLVEFVTGTNPKAAERDLNAFVGLTIFPITRPAFNMNIRLFGNNVAFATPGLRVAIEESYNLSQWSNFATHSSDGWTGIAPTALPSGGTTNYFWGPYTTPQVTPALFMRLKVEEE